MTRLSQLAETLIGSEIVRLGNQISARIRNGEKIYNYTIGDFDPNIFPIPLELEAGIIDSYQHHYTNYPPGEGVLELRQAVVQFIQEREGLTYDISEIQIASGGRPLIYSLFRTVVDPGDKVIYAVPSWNNNHYVHMTGGTHCVIEALPENNFMPTAAQLEPHMQGAALLCLCTPQNPTGTTFSKEELEKICDLVLAENARRSPEEKKLYVMFDQIYFTLTYGETQHYNPVSLRPEMKAYTIFIDGMSKAFAATGVRVGWSLGPANVIGKMKALLSHIGAWAPMAEQKAAADFLLQPDAINNFLTEFKARLEARLLAFYQGIIDLKEKGYALDAVAPQAAIYLTIRMDLVGKSYQGQKLENQGMVTDLLLSEAKLALVPFYAFGASPDSPWYRLSVGTSKTEEISEMLSKLENFLAQLQ
ncbi:aminotransferase class I/II-fold pyridoxal phosphate-dependent enzyme [Adhaeribacter sp. BT258]|uniref:Aminotransferase class I/II-fold pyridoxal phosphate-dependent enzyme n=1 Tax=Adhaeribacter terrigena TaxID=2793070 RepID=A0ABS1C4U9_9BACT|nr:aminotransferase class I/II-fold pyridoxal phosphate-dependent enzyme [Adhaeribacter terrigena]MBK0404385.1 aminotransferase class I/II-fold pyridoxal phosphate-dependent enzyme [Adhaeribacter terrigena]